MQKVDESIQIFAKWWMVRRQKHDDCRCLNSRHHNPIRLLWLKTPKAKGLVRAIFKENAVGGKLMLWAICSKVDWRRAAALIEWFIIAFSLGKINNLNSFACQINITSASRHVLVGSPLCFVLGVVLSGKWQIDKKVFARATKLYDNTLHGH